MGSVAVSALGGISLGPYLAAFSSNERLGEYDFYDDDGGDGGLFLVLKTVGVVEVLKARGIYCRTRGSDHPISISMSANINSSDCSSISS